MNAKGMEGVSVDLSAPRLFAQTVFSWSGFDSFKDPSFLPNPKT